MRACLLVLLSTAALAQQPGYRADYPEPPLTVPESAKFATSVSYTVPPGVTAPLRCELKDARGNVVGGVRVPVTGSGRCEVEFTAPSAAESPEITLALWMGEVWTQTLCPIVHTRPIRVLTAAQAARLAAQRADAAALRTRYAGLRTEEGLIGLYGPPNEALTNGLRPRFGLAQLDAAALSNQQVLTPDLFDVLVLTDCRALPAEGVTAVGRFVDRGGKLVAVGAPAFSQLTYDYQGRQLDRGEYLRAIAESLTVAPLLTFDAELGTWRRATNDATSPSRVVRETPGAHGTAGCLRLEITNQTGWDTFGTTPFERPFAPGASWTCFWAKGDANTSEVALEWDERDGSRWIATVPITTDWRPYALPPSAFKRWTAPNGRETFNPANATSLCVGLADTHTQQVGHGPHTLWLDEFGTAAPPRESGDALALVGHDEPLPLLEGVSPQYKLYPVTSGRSWRVDPHGVLGMGANGRLPVPPPTCLAPHPRPNGSGFGKGRPWRYVPLLELLDDHAEVAGSPLSLVINGADSAHGGLVVSAPSGDGFGKLVSTVERLADGLFLYEGGTARYATFGGEAMPLGATVTNRGRRAAQASVTIDIGTAYHRQWTVTVEPGQSATVQDTWQVPAGPATRYPVSVQLVSPRASDRLTHELRLWVPKAEPRFVTVRDGDFRLDGRPWFMHGVNYMPSTGIATENTPYFEYWLSAESYDSAVVERDLARCERIGFNIVSAFLYHRDLPARNLLDFLLRCEDHHLKVNLSLRPGTPLDFQWELVRDMIQTLRLAENDTVVAYDLAWEPNWGVYAERKVHDRAWAAWVARRYGSLAAAEAAWGCPLPRDGAAPTGPSDQQVSADGPHRQLVLDYRRFLKELCAEQYGRARDLVRSVDPHHLVSYRMSGAGDPTANPAWMTYDFAGLAKAVDFLAPEGYGRIGPWSKVRDGWFTTAYGRAVAPGLPLIWAEFGQSIWSQALNGPEPRRLAETTQYYDDFFKMVELSGGAGTICWWYPGGYRVNERSDFGIINADGSWRPITQVIHDWAPRLLGRTARPVPNATLRIAPEKRIDGLWGLYQDHQAEFWKLVEAGQVPSLKLD